MHPRGCGSSLQLELDLRTTSSEDGFHLRCHARYKQKWRLEFLESRLFAPVLPSQV
jgi:hypothetical protein